MYVSNFYSAFSTVFLISIKSISIALIVVGIIGRLYAEQYSHVTPDGILQDSIWLPIGTLMVMIAAVAQKSLEFILLVVQSG